MRGDPLSFFSTEKTASEADSGETSTAKKLDSGERALAGLAAQSSAYAIALPWVGGEILRHLTERNSVPWGGVAPLSGVTSIKDIPETMPSTGARVLGLFDVAGRAREATPEEWQRVVGKLDDIHEVVDSFFEKHHLGERGITLNFRSGPLTSIIGPHYDTATKKVFMPQVSKELVLHELGHAADYTGSRLGRFRAIAEPVVQRAAMAALPIALIAGDEIARAIPGTIDDHAIRFMQEHAPAIMGATLAATQLFPEAKASWLALRHIRDVEGNRAALDAAKKLVPQLGGYAVLSIPLVVGMALARKYMQSAGTSAPEKTAGLIGATVHELKEMGLDVLYVGKQIGRGAGELLRDPNVTKRITTAAKDVGTSPSFIIGALSSAIPAAAGALYLYGTDSGQVLRDQVKRVGRSTKEILGARPHDESWRERHPAIFAGIVGLGAALSAGILSKLRADVKEVL